MVGKSHKLSATRPSSPPLWARQFEAAHPSYPRGWMYWTLWPTSWMPNLSLELRRETCFGAVADVAVVVACLVAFVGFLEAKPITATGDVGKFSSCGWR